MLFDAMIVILVDIIPSLQLKKDTPAITSEHMFRMRRNTMSSQLMVIVSPFIRRDVMATCLCYCSGPSWL